MYEIELYPRGFVFYPKSDRTVPDPPTEAFSRQTLPDGAVLDLHQWAGRELAVSGDEWAVVIGLGLLYDASRGLVETEGLAQRFLTAAQRSEDDDAEVGELLYDMGGRYAVIVRANGVTRVYHDAHGNRTVYWRTDDGTVASHYDILERMAPGKPNTHPLADLTLGGRWEHTDDAQIRALLPNHRLEVEHRCEVRFFPLRANPFTQWSAEQRSREISKVWHAQLEAVLELKRPNVMSVTAGTDSRLLMSFVRGREEHFMSFTYGPHPDNSDYSRFTRSLRKDLERAQKLVAELNLNHRFLHFDQSKASLLDKGILNRNTVHAHGRWILPLYLENFTDPQTLFYRGNLVETARGHTYVAPGADWHPAVETLLLARSPGLLPEDRLERAREATREEMRRYESPDIHPDYLPGDLAYWEVRMGRFLSEVSNETDVAFDVWMPINQRRLLDLFMAYPLHDRYDEAALFEVIDREYPLLNSFDINDKPSMIRRAGLLRDEQRLLEQSIGRQPERAYIVHPDQTETETALTGRELALTKDTFIQGTEVVRSWSFAPERGAARMVLRSPWTNARGRGYMEVEVGVGEKTHFHQDLAETSLSEQVDLLNLQRDDQVWVRLRALRTISAESWFRASRTEIISYTEQSDD